MSADPLAIRSAPHAPVPAIVSEFIGRERIFGERLRVESSGGDDLRAFATQLERTPFPRQHLVETLRTLNRACENPAAEDAIAALADSATLVVATGQQPGFCGGPLYSVFKAATAIAEARRLSRLLKRRVVPLFWIASDDHDLAEIGGIALLSNDLDFKRHRVRFREEFLPSGQVVVDEAIVAAFAAVKADPAADLSNVAFPEPRLGERWPIWFGRILAFLFPHSGLVLFEPTECRPLFGPFLERAARDPRASVAALAAGAERLREVGREHPLPVDVSSLLFHVAGSRRQRWIPDDGTPFARSSFPSPDAALRCVMQSAVLPAVQVLGGPGELNYWMQLRELFELHEVAMPYFALRFSATFVTPQIRRAAEAVAIAESDWFLPERDLEERMKRANSIDTTPWEREAANVRTAFQAFAQPLAQLGGTLPTKTAQAEAALAGSLAKLIEASSQRVREAAGVSEKKVRLLARSVFPGGLLQERATTALPYLSRYGSDLFERLALALPDQRVPHSFIDLGTPGAA